MLSGQAFRYNGLSWSQNFTKARASTEISKFPPPNIGWADNYDPHIYSYKYFQVLYIRNLICFLGYNKATYRI